MIDNVNKKKLHKWFQYAIISKCLLNIAIRN